MLFGVPMIVYPLLIAIPAIIPTLSSSKDKVVDLALQHHLHMQLLMPQIFFRK